jgi:hypothetical protein
MNEQLRRIDDMLRSSYLIQINSPEKEKYFQEALKSLEKVITSDALYYKEKKIYENN